MDSAKHPYHLVDPSPWPFAAGVLALAVAFSFTMMMTSVGTSLGPLITGFLTEATGDLKLALFIMSFTSVSLILAGMTLGFGVQPEARETPEPAGGC